MDALRADRFLESCEIRAYTVDWGVFNRGLMGVRDIGIVLGLSAVVGSKKIVLGGWEKRNSVCALKGM